MQIEEKLEYLENHTSPGTTIAECLGDIRIFIESQQQEIKRLKGDRWKDFTKFKPKPEQQVWTYFEANGQPCYSFGIYDKDKEAFYEGRPECEFSVNVTHWQPLPKEPKK